MLAKLVAPMDPERAARAYVDMLPMLPEDDELYNRATLHEAATCDRKTAVPNYADLSRVLGKESISRLPVRLRMGYKQPERLAETRYTTAQDKEAVALLVKALIAELKAKSIALKQKKY